MSATNSTGRANHSLLMTFCSPHAVADFDVPPTASHKNNSAKLVRANAVALNCTSGKAGSEREPALGPPQRIPNHEVRHGWRRPQLAHPRCRSEEHTSELQS